VLDHLGDVCVDLSRFHGVTDAARMDSASFLAAAARLMRYDGAVRRSLVEEIEHKNAEERPASAAELMARPDLQAQPGWGPVVEVTKVPKAS
jgi:hypothetical protein